MPRIIDLLLAPYGGATFDTAERAGADEEKPKRKPNGRTVDEEGDDDPPVGYFSRQYVSELRAENKGYRLKATEAEQKRAAAEKAKEDAEKALKEAETAAAKKAEQRVMRAELKALALKEGMIDLDGLQFIDYTSISFDEKGELKGGAEALTKLKTSKPYLFGTSTTSNKSAPDAKSSSETVDARKLNKDEYAALKTKLGIRV